MVLIFTDLSLPKFNFSMIVNWELSPQFTLTDMFYAVHCIKPLFFDLVKKSSQMAFCFLREATVMGAQVTFSLFLLDKEKDLGWGKHDLPINTQLCGRCCWQGSGFCI